jgi:hypothetical protein
MLLGCGTVEVGFISFYESFISPIKIWDGYFRKRGLTV